MDSGQDHNLHRIAYCNVSCAVFNISYAQSIADHERLLLLLLLLWLLPHLLLQLLQDL